MNIHLFFEINELQNFSLQFEQKIFISLFHIFFDKFCIVFCIFSNDIGHLDKRCGRSCDFLVKPDTDEMRLFNNPIAQVESIFSIKNGTFR